MHRFSLPIIITFVALLAGCHSPKDIKPLDQRIADAHGLDEFHRYEGMSGDLHLHFNTGEQLDTHFIHRFKTGQTRMQLADESILVYDGRDSWIFPPNSPIKDARYHLRLWPFLATLPLQLHYPGATLSEPQSAALAGTQYQKLTLQFSPTAGDRANDRYVIYADPETNRVKTIGCVFVGSQTFEIAESTAIAITYYNYKPTDGVMLAEDWKIWRFNTTAGIYDQPIGQARLYNLQFFTPKDSAFVPPAGARKQE